MVAFYQRSSTPEGTETLNCDFCCSAMRIYSRHTSLCRPKVTIMYFFWVGGVGLNKPKLKHHFHFSFYGDDSSAGSAVLFFFKECTQPSHAQILFLKKDACIVRRIPRIQTHTFPLQGLSHGGIRRNVGHSFIAAFLWGP